MIEYLPWSKTVLNECIAEYKHGKFTVLDIDLGGECNFTCIYCDSPYRKKPCSISLDTIECFLKSHQFKWIHICGIGEPTFSKNYDLLLSLLKLCEKYNLKCNMFSNVFNLTTELIEFIEKDILYILFKIDTFSNTHAANLYGIDSKQAQKQIENVKKLTNLVKIKNGCTNLAASIVPTNINHSVIIPIIKDMCDCNIFPMIGDLENSGRGKEHFNALSLSEPKLSQLKQEINNIIGVDYNIPQCPAVISSIHIDTNNNIIVDEFTGLSCNWFWLEEPKMKVLFKLTEKTTLHEVTKKLMLYRQAQIPKIIGLLDSYKTHSPVFGGCGGDVLSLLETYIEAHGGIT